MPRGTRCPASTQPAWAPARHAGARPPPPPPTPPAPLHNRRCSQSAQVAAGLSHCLGVRQVSPTFVGPTWGSQISQKALQALIAFLVVIVIYLSIAFEWKMAVAALIALAHDIVITIGVYALAAFDVSPASVLVLLPILGYSLYDTLLAFD